MHILMFSYDKALVEGNLIGGTLLRLKHYAEYLDRLDILLPLPARQKRAEIRVDEKITIYPSYGPKLLSWLRSYLTARRICRESKVDIVDTQDALLGALGVLLRTEFGCRLFINALGLEIFSDWWLKGSPLHRFYKLVMCWTLRRADMIRVAGTRDGISLIQKLKIPPRKVMTMPTVLAPESIAKFANADGHVVKENLLGDRYDKMVLFVGMLIKQKNIPNLLKAAKLVLNNHPKTLFAIIGDGPEKDYLSRLCRELDVAQYVRFLGLVPYDNLPEYYAACDLFVLPSWFEGLAKVLMEAAYAQKPIVATNVSGANDIIIDNETGYIVEVDNPQQLADRIEKLLENPDKAITMGAQGYKHAINYCDFPKNLEKRITAWKGMLAVDETRG